MLGLRKDKKPSAKPRPNQPSKIPKKQDVKSITTQRVTQKQKKVEQSPNPYKRFIDGDKLASLEELTKYFELRTSRFNARSTISVVLGLSVFAVLVTAYYNAVQLFININSMLLGNIITATFVAVTIVLMIFIKSNLSVVSESNFEKHFRWYLEAKRYFIANRQSLEMQTTKAEPVEAAEDIEIQDEDNTVSDSEA